MRRRSGPPHATPPDAWAALRRTVAEAVILQDAAEDLLADLRLRPDPSELARPCGRLKGRFVELREALPLDGDPEVERYAGALRQVLDHHVLLLKTSLGLLAGAQRCEALDERLDDVDGLGAQGRRLEAIRADLLRRAAAG
jgi:hypothetical protein